MVEVAGGNEDILGQPTVAVNANLLSLVAQRRATQAAVDAAPAGPQPIHRDPIAHRPAVDIPPHIGHLAGDLVPRYDRLGLRSARQPRHVQSAEADTLDADQDFVGSGGRHGKFFQAPSR